MQKLNVKPQTILDLLRLELHHPQRDLLFQSAIRRTGMPLFSELYEMKPDVNFSLNEDLQRLQQAQTEAVTTRVPKTGTPTACFTSPMYSQRGGRDRRSGATRG